MNRRQHSSRTITTCSVATPRPPAIRRTAACMTAWTCALRGNPILSHYSDALALRGRASLISDVGGNRRLASSARGLLGECRDTNQPRAPAAFPHGLAPVSVARGRQSIPLENCHVCTDYEG